MAESFQVSCTFAVSAERLYHAWLDSKEHSRFTGSPAEIQPVPGGTFSAWDGYIQGKSLDLEPHKRIVQAWRSTDFPPDSPDSRLEVLFKPVKDGTELILIHSGLPDGQGAGYEQGWIDYYFTPMQEYFAPDEAL